MILSGENLITFSLYLLNDHWVENQNHLLCWALMSWARFISQLKFQYFITCRNHLYLLSLLPGKVLSSFAFSTYLASLQMSISKQAYSLYLWASLPQNKKCIIISGSHLGGSEMNFAALYTILLYPKIFPRHDSHSYSRYQVEVLNKWHIFYSSFAFHMPLNYFVLWPHLMFICFAYYFLIGIWRLILTPCKSKFRLLIYNSTLGYVGAFHLYTILKTSILGSFLLGLLLPTSIWG